MFTNFQNPPADAILELAIAFRKDTRPNKIDLGIGVYKDQTGATPVMRAVKEAEKRVWETENSKAYLGLGGDEVFARSVQELVVGDAVDAARVRSIQTVGGGAAVRLLADLVAEGKSGAIWIPNPTWINHGPIGRAAGMEVRQYTYLDTASNSVAFDQMADELSKVAAGEVVVLHGCCHNPTGADLTLDQWKEVAAIIRRNRAIPFVDIAYQGFGDGLDADATGLRIVAAEVPEMVISASCSKNFGVYRDRVGAALLVGEDAVSVDRAKGILLSKGRVNYSFPANHGAATIATIFNDPALLADWKSELEGMRQRMLNIRIALSAGLAKATGTSRFDFIKANKGMFSLLGVGAPAVDRLREDYAIFLPPDGRMNIAAVKEAEIDYLANAFAKVI